VATLSSWKRWVVALHGARQRSGIEKIGISGEWRIADIMDFRYDGVIEGGGGTPQIRGENHGGSGDRADQQ
jgi:hypothetical protein